MKRAVWVFVAMAALALTLRGSAQGTFQNLDYENPIPPLTPDPIVGVVPITNAIPGWTGYLNGNPTDLVFNRTSLWQAHLFLS